MPPDDPRGERHRAARRMLLVQRRGRAELVRTDGGDEPGHPSAGDQAPLWHGSDEREGRLVLDVLDPHPGVGAPKEDGARVGGVNLGFELEAAPERLMLVLLG